MKTNDAKPTDAEIEAAYRAIEATRAAWLVACHAVRAARDQTYEHTQARQFRVADARAENAAGAAERRGFLAVRDAANAFGRLAYARWPVAGDITFVLRRLFVRVRQAGENYSVEPLTINAAMGDDAAPA